MKGKFINEQNVEILNRHIIYNGTVYSDSQNDFPKEILDELGYKDIIFEQPPQIDEEVERLYRYAREEEGKIIWGYKILLK